MNDEVLPLICQLATQAAAQTPIARAASAWRMQQAIRTVAQVVSDLDDITRRHITTDDLERYVEAYLEAYDAAAKAHQANGGEQA